jgi:hypothetical protein
MSQGDVQAASGDILSGRIVSGNELIENVPAPRVRTMPAQGNALSPTGDVFVRLALNTEDYPAGLIVGSDQTTATMRPRPSALRHHSPAATTRSRHDNPVHRLFWQTTMTRRSTGGSDFSIEMSSSLLDSGMARTGASHRPSWRRMSNRSTKWARI